MTTDLHQIFQYHQNKICVAGGWLYGEGGIIPKGTYKTWQNREKFKSVKKGGNGRNALIEYESLPDTAKAKIEAKIGGSPYELFKKTWLRDAMQPDPKAAEFFAGYVTEQGEHLDTATQQKYINDACILNAIIARNTERKTVIKSTGHKFFAKYSYYIQRIAELNTAEVPNSLHAVKNPDRLYRRITEYKSQGYACLIHGNTAKRNAEKINDHAKLWVLARWSAQVNRCTGLAQLLQEYNLQAIEKNWKPLKSEQTLHNFLHEPEVQPLWYIHRHGSEAAQNKFVYQHTTKLPQMRDMLWYSDGTRLNLFYLNASGHSAATMVYEVMDAYSEVMLGYGIGDIENFDMQYKAYRMALEFAGCKPNEIRYDNQGGHKKAEAQLFFQNAAKHSMFTRPYNGKSKTIESAFGRFQSQILKKYWFFTGQNLTAKKLDGKHQEEFVKANVANLPTYNEMIKHYQAARNEWNYGIHPKTGISRMEMYLKSHNPKTVKLQPTDLISLFWVQKPDTTRCNAGGIVFTRDNVKYEYMVQRPDGMPDIEWLTKNIDRDFYVHYDPLDDTMVALYKQTATGKVFDTFAKSKVVIHRALGDQQEGERKFIEFVQHENNRIITDNYEYTENLLIQHNMHPQQHGLNSPNLRGINSNKQTKKPKTQTKAQRAENYKKRISNLVPALDKEESHADMY